MTQEEKQLLLKDLCARLPYGVKVKTSNGMTRDLVLVDLSEPEVRPYLRPMSSMTEEEYEESCCVNEWTHLEDGSEVPCMAYIDLLNAHHFDYRGLIEKGMALEAPKDMYKTE